MTLYDTDLCQWVEQQAELLEKKEFDKLDLENLVDEVKSMNWVVQQNFSRDLKIMMLYLLLKENQPFHITDLLINQKQYAQSSIELLLDDCPSLLTYFNENKDHIYKLSVYEFNLATRIYALKFAKKCPWTIKDILG